MDAISFPSSATPFRSTITVRWLCSSCTHRAQSPPVLSLVPASQQDSGGSAIYIDKVGALIVDFTRHFVFWFAQPAPTMVQFSPLHAGRRHVSRCGAPRNSLLMLHDSVFSRRCSRRQGFSVKIVVMDLGGVVSRTAPRSWRDVAKGARVFEFFLQVVKFMLAVSPWVFCKNQSPLTIKLHFFVVKVRYQRRGSIQLSANWLI